MQQTDMKCILIVMLDWSEIIGGYNAADTAVRDRMKQNIQLILDDQLFY